MYELRYKQDKSRDDCMNILLEIIEHKKTEMSGLPECEFYMRETETLADCKGFINKLESISGPALIAELKKASPSKGILRADYKPLEIAKQYEIGGAACLSVLTDEKYFQGSIKDLQIVASKSPLPCLRKDFIIDKRQIAISRIAGADAILLIAAVLSNQELKKFHGFARDLDLDVLVEVHNAEEMDKALAINAKLIGINNRDLKTFNVDLDITRKLVTEYKNDLENKLIVSESGIFSNSDMQELYKLGVKAFLVGESLITQSNAVEAVRKLLN